VFRPPLGVSIDGRTFSFLSSICLLAQLMATPLCKLFTACEQVHSTFPSNSQPLSKQVVQQHHRKTTASTSSLHRLQQTLLLASIVSRLSTQGTRVPRSFLVCFFPLILNLGSGSGNSLAHGAYVERHHFHHHQGCGVTRNY
jgi:hypothetical protein